ERDEIRASRLYVRVGARLGHWFWRLAKTIFLKSVKAGRFYQRPRRARYPTADVPRLRRARRLRCSRKLILPDRRVFRFQIILNQISACRFSLAVFETVQSDGTISL